MIRFLLAVAILWSIVLARGTAAALLAIPDKLIVLTFDDGNQSDYTLVAPLLKQYNFGATFYVTSNCDWLGIPDRDAWRLSWAPIKEMQRDGFEIGNHSYSHKNVVPLSRDDTYVTFDVDSGRYRFQLTSGEQYLKHADHLI